MKPFVLASSSASRAAMLSDAGVRFETVRPAVDETALKLALLAEGGSPRDVADALAEAKAVQVSRRRSGLILGADTTLELDGRLFDKPNDLTEARRHLELFSGRTHLLHSAAVIAENGAPIWRDLKTAKLMVRPLSPDFLDHYIEAEGSKLLSCVGAYRLEGLGAQIFAAVEGDYFTVLGLPLLPVLDHLRRQGVLKT